MQMRMMRIGQDNQMMMEDDDAKIDQDGSERLH